MRRRSSFFREEGGGGGGGESLINRERLIKDLQNKANSLLDWRGHRNLA